MKKHILSFFLVLVSIHTLAWNSPVTIPDLGNARLRVVAQNAANYLTNFEASNSSCDNQDEFDTKTNKMANAFLALKADIVAICEVERNDDILSYICDAMNTIYGKNVFTYITDGLYSHASAGDYQSLKSGFIYNKEKVTPFGSAVSPYNSGEYNARMRIQAFKELATDEIFVLSMNHFKAKSSGSDSGESTRIQNASYLISKLNNVTSDDDILIMGDLNAYTDETPIQNLINAGYEEQLVRFAPTAYTYIYKGTKGILDHAMANSTMAEQITGAYSYHINTAGGYSYKYSDHDAVVVGLCLGNDPISVFEPLDATAPARKILHNGQIFIELNGHTFTVTGTKVQ
jgi:predicted extracellular nuclease